MKHHVLIEVNVAKSGGEEWKWQWYSTEMTGQEAVNIGVQLNKLNSSNPHYRGFRTEPMIRKTEVVV